jgi:hypothetical protein
MKVKMNADHWWNNTGGGKTEILRGKPVLVPVYPLQIRHGLAWGETQAA